MTFPNVSAGVGEVIAEQTLFIRQGDRLPSLVMQVVDEFGDAIDLTDRTAWLVTRPTETAQGGGLWGTPRETVIFDREEGVVVYDWQQIDTINASPGLYELIVEIRYLDGSTDFTAPTRRDTFIGVRSDVPLPS